MAGGAGGRTFGLALAIHLLPVVRGMWWSAAFFTALGPAHLKSRGATS
jgi:hypothetical protein